MVVGTRMWADGDNLFAVARACLEAVGIEEKLSATATAASRFAAGAFTTGDASPALLSVTRPGRPQRPRLVAPRKLAQRGLGTEHGRAALVHAIAHIEFNAINLAWDAVHRFRDMPDKYYRDWVSVAADEARHFSMLRERLAELGHAYGDFDAHDGLWEMAVRTSDSCLRRMALVPRVLEARGLDVTPGMIKRLRGAGDQRTVAILETILREEVSHVAAGSRWFAWCCERDKREPESTFRELLGECAPGALKGPFNEPARLAAGFSRAEIAQLEAAA